VLPEFNIFNSFTYAHILEIINRKNCKQFFEKILLITNFEKILLIRNFDQILLKKIKNKIIIIIMIRIFSKKYQNFYKKFYQNF